MLRKINKFIKCLHLFTVFLKQMCQFPGAAITDLHKLKDKHKTTNLFSHSFVGQNSETEEGQAPSEDSGEESFLGSS